MKFNYIIAIIVSVAIGCKESIDFDHYETERYRDHTILINDDEGTPVKGADVYLYFVQNGDSVLLSKQETDDNGMVYYHKSYLGDYSVDIGFLGSVTKINAGKFKLQLAEPDRHAYTMPHFSELSTQSINLAKEGGLANGEQATLSILTTYPWKLTEDNESNWLGKSLTKGDRGRYSIQLSAPPLAEAGRGTILNFEAEDDETIATKKIYVEQLGTPYLQDNFDWLTALHTQPEKGDFLNVQTQTYMQGWGSDKDYHNWTRYNFPGVSAATYSGLGFFKISTGSRGGGIISPKLSAIPVGTKENVRLFLDIAKYIPASGSPGTGEVQVDITGDGTFNDGSKTISLTAGNNRWNVFETKSIFVLGVNSETQFVIRASQVGGNQQFLLDNVTITRAVHEREQ